MTLVPVVNSRPSRLGLGGILIQVGFWDSRYAGDGRVDVDGRVYSP